MTLNKVIVMSRSKWIRSEEKIRIVISKETHKKLLSLKHGNECFDSVLKRLLNSYVQLKGY